MNPAEAKEKLKKEKDDLETTLSRFADKKGGLDDDWKARFPDMKFETSEDRIEDAAHARQEYEVLRSVEQTLEVKLKKVKEALERIEKGEYGKCKKCGKEISGERLEAVPEALLCQDCKNK